MVRRVARGAELARMHPHLLVAVAGGWLRGPMSEASVMVRLLDQEGIAPNRILSEDHSLNTFENILYLRDMLPRWGVTRIYLVTDSFHMPRAIMTCRWLGLEAHAYPVWHPRAEVWYWIVAHFREAVAIPYYVYRLFRHSLRVARR